MAGLGYTPGAAAGTMGFNPSYVDNNGNFGYNGVSQDPAMGVGGYPSEAAAQAAWFAANPQYAQFLSDPNVAAAGGPAGSNLTGIGGNASTQNLAAGFTGNSNPAIAGGYNPLQPAYLGAPPTLNATTAQGQTYNPTGYQAQSLSPQLMQSLGADQTLKALQNSVAPIYGQQDQQMMQMLAANGIAPGSTAGTGIFGNLAQQQLAGISPAMAAAIQNSQGNQLNAGQFNANTQNQGGQFNAGALNTAGQYNAGNLQNAGQFNANAQNVASGQNLSNILQQQLYNANAYNTAGNNYFNAATGAYNNNANAFNALNQQGLSGGQNLASQQASGGNTFANTMQGNYPVYQSQPINYGAFSGSPNYSDPYSSYNSSIYAGGSQTQAPYEQNPNPYSSA